jgi:hypothetical protein
MSLDTLTVPYLACQLSWFRKIGDNKICVWGDASVDSLQMVNRWDSSVEVKIEGLYWFRLVP